jgi:hypothetical protein
MTLEYNDTVPFHFNTCVRGQTVYFNGSDHKDLWEKNIKISENYKFFEENGWLDEKAISYTFNTHGFRCEEFDQRPAWLALGCSFTEGVGLSINDVWPILLNKLIDKHIWNMGVGSSALDTCFRLLDYYIDKLNVQGIFLLQPPKHRIEIFTDGKPVMYLPSDEYDKHYPLFKHWISDDTNVTVSIRKNLLAIQKLCDSKDVRLITRPSTDLNSGKSYCRARDLIHHGKNDHVHLANLFYEDYKNGNS